jgi:hypothetical protein
MSHSSLSCLKNSGTNSSIGSYSGQSPLVHSLSLGYSICLSINTVLSLSLSIMVVSPFSISPTSVSAKGTHLGLSTGSKNEGKEVMKYKEANERFLLVTSNRPVGHRSMSDIQLGTLL